MRPGRSGRRRSLASALRWRIVAASDSSPIAGSSSGSAAWRAPIALPSSLLAVESSPRRRRRSRRDPHVTRSRAARGLLRSRTPKARDPPFQAPEPKRVRARPGRRIRTHLPAAVERNPDVREVACLKNHVRECRPLKVLLVVADDTAAQHEHQQEERASSGPHRRAASPSCGSPAPRRESRRPCPLHGRPPAGSGLTRPPSSRSPSPCRSRCTG